MSFSMLPPLETKRTAIGPGGAQGRSASFKGKPLESPAKDGADLDLEAMSRVELVRSFSELQDKHGQRKEAFDQLSEKFATADKQLSEEIARSSSYLKRALSLERDAKRLTEEFERRGEEISKAEAKLRNARGLEQALIEERERADALVFEVKTLHEQLQAANQRLKNASTQESRTQEIEDNLKTTKGLLERKSAEAQAIAERCSRLEKELDKSRQQMTVIEDGVVEEKQRIVHLQSEVSSLLQQRDALQSLLSATERDKAQASDHLCGEQDRLKSALIEKSDIEDRLRSTEQENLELQQQAKQLNADLALLKAETQESEEQLQKQISALKRIVDEKQKGMAEEAKAAAMEVVRLEEELGQMMRRNEELGERLRQSQEEATEHRCEKERREQEKMSAARALRDREMDVARLTAELDSVRTGLAGGVEQLEGELMEARRRAAEELQSRWRAEEDWKREREQQEAEMKRLERAVEAREKGREAETKRLRLDLEAVSEKNSRLREQVDQLEAQLEEARQLRKEDGEREAQMEDERGKREAAAKKLEQALQAKGFEVGRLERDKLELKQQLDRTKAAQRESARAVQSQLEQTAEELAEQLRIGAGLQDRVAAEEQRAQHAEESLAAMLEQESAARAREEELGREVRAARAEAARARAEVAKASGAVERGRAEAERLRGEAAAQAQTLQQAEEERQRVEGRLRATQEELTRAKAKEEAAGKDLGQLREMAGRVGEVELRLEKKDKCIERTDKIIAKLMSDIDKVRQHAAQNGLLEQLPFLIS